MEKSMMIHLVIQGHPGTFQQGRNTKLMGFCWDFFTWIRNHYGSWLVDIFLVQNGNLYVFEPYPVKALPVPNSICLPSGPY